MITYARRVLFLLILFSFPLIGLGQNIFSEKAFENKNKFLPYDVPYTFPLEDKEFVMLSELKKNRMILGRYDEYFFEKWEREIEFDKNESTPQLFIKGDSIVTFSFTSASEKNQFKLSFRYFELQNGTDSTSTNYAFDAMENERFSPKISFSTDRSKFVVYNYLVKHQDSSKVEFQIFELGRELPLIKHYLNIEKFTSTKSNAVSLSNDGDLLMVLIEVDNFKIETYYWASNSKEARRIQNNFFFERPAGKIGNINIIRQSNSSYFVSFSAFIEEELIGFNVTGINVVLRTVMFSHNQNFRKNEIESLYDNYYVTSNDQRKKHLEVPDILEGFRLVGSFENTENDVIILIENLEIPTPFHEKSASGNMAWKYKTKQDKFYFGGDILLYCFTETGEIKWKKSIQKTQFSQANSLGLSFIPRMNKDALKLFLYESSKNGNFYILDINASDGSLIKTTNLLPDEKFEFTKKYSCWLNDNAMVICGISPTNYKKRTLMLVEF